MKYAYIIAGFVFIINPNVNVFDILPDFIGYALIMYGLGKTSYMSDDIGDAERHLKTLIYIGIGKFILMFLIPSMSDTAFRLVFTFTFGVFESGLLILFFNKLFSGMEYLAMRHNGSSAYIKISETHTIAVVFTLVKGLFTLLPELKYLSTTDYEGYITALEQFDIANYGTMLLILNIVAVTSVGIVTLVMVVKYFCSIKSDKVFNDNINLYYNNEIAVKKEMFFIRHINISLLFMIAGFIFMADIYVDGIDVTPDFIGAALILTGLLIVRKDFVVIKSLLLPSYIYLPLTLFAWLFSLIFGLKYYRYSIYKSFEAYYMYIGTIIISIIEAAVFIWLMSLMAKYFRTLIEEHLGFVIEPMFKSLNEKREIMLKKLKKHLKIWCILNYVMAVSTIFQVIFLYIFDEYWLIHPIVGIIWLYVSLTLLINIKKETNNRYEYSEFKTQA